MHEQCATSQRRSAGRTDTERDGVPQVVTQMYD